jgi:hypothetical protein
VSDKVKKPEERYPEVPRPCIVDIREVVEI